MIRAEVSLEIPFHDVDSMGIVWHGHYLKYIEIARCELMRKAGLDLPAMDRAGLVWPIVTCDLKYLRPLRYGQRITVEARLEEYEYRIVLSYLVRDAATGEKHTRARTVQLAVNPATGEAVPETPAFMVEAFRRAGA